MILPLHWVRRGGRPGGRRRGRAARPAFGLLEGRLALSTIFYDGNRLSIAGDRADDVVVLIPAGPSTLVVMNGGSFAIPATGGRIGEIRIDVGDGNNYVDLSRMADFRGHA